MQNLLIQNITQLELAEIMEAAIERAFQKQAIHTLPAPAESADEFLTKKDAAAYLHISVVTLSKYIRSGYVKAHTVTGTRLKFKRSDLDKAFRTLRNPAQLQEQSFVNK